MYAKILLMTAVLLTGQVFAQSTTDTSTSTPSTSTSKTKKKKKSTAVTATPAEATATTTTTTTTPVIAEVKKEEPKTEVAPVEVLPTTVPGKAYKYLKDKFSASFHGEVYYQRRDVDSANEKDHNMQDLRVMYSPTVIYKPFKNWQVLANGEFKYNYAAKAAAGTFTNDYFRSLFTITKKNVVVEKNSGFQLDLGVGRRDINTRTHPKNFGNSRVNATVTKNFGKHSGSLFIQYLYNDPNQIDATTWKHGAELIPTLSIQLSEKLSYLITDDIVYYTPKYSNTEKKYSIIHDSSLAYITYQWTDKLSTYYQFKYLHDEDFTNAGTDDHFEHYAGIGYSLTPKITVTGEIGSEIFHAHDGKDAFLTNFHFTKKARYPELALYLDIAL
jgi:hypothetical protein